MASFFSFNAGLYRRIPFRLSFPNYAREDLCQIFRAMMAKYKYRVDDERTIEEAFSHVDDSQIGSMNAGLCQLILEKAKDNLIGRLSMEQLMTADLDTISREDLIEAAKSLPPIPGRSE